MQHEHAHSSPEKHHHAHKDADSCCHAADTAADIPVAPLAKGEHLFRIDAMDCSAEESEIRQVLEPITGIAGRTPAAYQRTRRCAAAGAGRHS